MKRVLLASLALAATLASAAQAQLVNFPVYAIPVGGEAPATLIAGGWGRGLNDASGKINSFGVAVGRTGIGGRGSALVGANWIDFPGEAEYSFAGIGAVGVSVPESPTQISVQAGIGYFSPISDVSTWSIPIGIGLAQNIPGESASFVVWGMPRIHLSRASVLGTSATETDFGGSAGFVVNLASGLGLHSAIDILVADPDNVMTFGVGVHYMIP
jgi:hypothetical protein